jgi:uncharacterized sporulation protein YeaH/YhbH (DUF444 family)
MKIKMFRTFDRSTLVVPVWFDRVDEKFGYYAGNETKAEVAVPLKSCFGSVDTAREEIVRQFTVMLNEVQKREHEIIETILRFSPVLNPWPSHP